MLWRVCQEGVRQGGTGGTVQGYVRRVQGYGWYGTRARVVPNPYPSYPQTRTPKKHDQVREKHNQFWKMYIYIHMHN